MHLNIIGCEYSGTTTLGYALTQWTEQVMGYGVGFHDHWKIPHLSHPGEAAGKLWADWAEGRAEDPTRLGFSEDEQKRFLALTRSQQEMFQRYHMEYHISTIFYAYDHHNVMGMQIDEAVYAGLYYGYGGDGEYSDRRPYARHVEERILEMAPDSIVVLCQAAPDVIRRRMKENPHKGSLLQEKDTEFVVGRFEEEYERCLFKNKITVDTGTKTVDASLAEFVGKYEEFMTEPDRMRILVHKAKQRGEWV